MFKIGVVWDSVGTPFFLSIGNPCMAYPRRSKAGYQPPRSFCKECIVLSRFTASLIHPNCPGLVLAPFWRISGFVLASFGFYSCLLLAFFWFPSDFLLSSFWAAPGSLLASFWISSGFLLVLLWLRSGLVELYIGKKHHWRNRNIVNL